MHDPHTDVYKIDRLSRSLKDLIDIVAELNQFDIGFRPAPN
jgi:DNA invertase Pin-like site-specific DNA recombinase